jgi:hypothetical protein
MRRGADPRGRRLRLGLASGLVSFQLANHAVGLRFRQRMDRARRRYRVLAPKGFEGQELLTSSERLLWPVSQTAVFCWPCALRAVPVEAAHLADLRSAGLIG